MYDKHLDAFMAVAEAGSFSAAVKKLFISHTALMQQINILERDLGVRLFKRTHKGVILTESGEYLYEEARKLIRHSQQIMKNLRETEKYAQETIRIGMLPNFAPVLLPEICRKYLEEYPEHHIEFVEYPLGEYFQNFERGLFDITTEYMLGYIFRKPKFSFVKLTEDRHCYNVAAKHPLAGKERLKLKDLEGQNIIMYAPGITKADDRLRNYLLSKGSGIKITDISYYTNSLALKCELEQAILVNYSMYVKSYPSLVPLELDVDFPIDIGLVCKSDAKVAVKNFIRLARTMFPFGDRK